MLETHDVNMIMSMDNGKIKVSLFPHLKKGLSNGSEVLPPFNMTATPEELDKNFIPALEKIGPKTGEIMTNIQFYAKQMKAKEEEAKKKATEKAGKKPATTTSAPAAKAGGTAQAAQPTMFDQAEEKSEESE